jgi:hypothetical protein
VRRFSLKIKGWPEGTEGYIKEEISHVEAEV